MQLKRLINYGTISDHIDLSPFVIVKHVFCCIHALVPVGSIWIESHSD